MTARQLAGELEVSVRTVQRDLAALEAAGIPLMSVRGEGGGWALEGNYRTELTGMSAAEAVAMAVGRPATLLPELGLEDAGEAAITKVLASLPERIRIRAEQARRLVHVDLSSWDGEQLAALPDLHRAIVEHRLVRFRYALSESLATVAPLGLVAKGLVWYLVAERDDRARTYRIGKIADLVVLDQTSERPRNFDLERYWKEASARFQATLPSYFGSVRLRGEAARRVRYLPGARIDRTTAPDADGWVEVDIDFESESEARSYLLGLGGEMIVLHPPELRSAIVASAGRVLELNSEPP
jgi:predicted DNA-binding transcriptional regulator YafY